MENPRETLTVTKQRTSVNKGEVDWAKVDGEIIVAAFKELENDKIARLEADKREVHSKIWFENDRKTVLKAFERRMSKDVLKKRHITTIESQIGGIGRTTPMSDYVKSIMSGPPKPNPLKTQEHLPDKYISMMQEQANAYSPYKTGLTIDTEAPALTKE